MGMSLGVKSQTLGPSENQEWLGSEVGTKSQDSITLDAALCVAKFPTGFVPSGIPLKRQGTGRYAPALVADTTADYFLFTSCDLTVGGMVTPAAAADMPASGMWHGEIVAAKIPVYAGQLVLAANTVAQLFKFV